MDEPTVGLVGLGLVGSALAERFLKAEMAVVGFDLSNDRQANLVARGGTATEAPGEVADRADLIVLSLPNSEIVREVVESLGLRLRAGTLVIDTTTGDPEPTAALGEELADRGVTYLDATIVGSSEHVRSGEAIVLVGGTVEAFDAARAVFAAFAEKVFHVGPWGSGARMKLVVNLVIGLNRAVLAEGLALASARGSIRRRRSTSSAPVWRTPGSWISRARRCWPATSPRRPAWRNT